jgi:hypothetical protein
MPSHFSAEETASTSLSDAHVAAVNTDKVKQIKTIHSTLRIIFCISPFFATQQLIYELRFYINSTHIAQDPEMKK